MTIRKKPAAYWSDFRAEDQYNFRVNKLLEKLSDAHGELLAMGETDLGFEEWLSESKDAVGHYFLEDLEKHLGVKQAIQNLQVADDMEHMVPMTGNAFLDESAE